MSDALAEMAEQAQAEYTDSRQELADYIAESASTRVILVTEGSVQQVLMVLSHEMGVAGARGDIYRVSRLAQMAERLSHAEATLTIRDQASYRQLVDDDDQEPEFLRG